MGRPEVGAVCFLRRLFIEREQSAAGATVRKARWFAWRGKCPRDLIYGQVPTVLRDWVASVRSDNARLNNAFGRAMALKILVC